MADNNGNRHRRCPVSHTRVLRERNRGLTLAQQNQYLQERIQSLEGSQRELRQDRDLWRDMALSVAPTAPANGRTQLPWPRTLPPNRGPTLTEQNRYLQERIQSLKGSLTELRQERNFWRDMALDTRPPAAA